MKIKKIKAWAIITKRGAIPLVSKDDWTFYWGIFENKSSAKETLLNGYSEEQFKIIPILITYSIKKSRPIRK